MALTRIYYHQDIQGIIPGGDDYEPIRKDFENTWKYLKSPAKGTKLDNSDAKFWKEKNFTFPNRTQLDKEKQKIPNTIVIKSSQAVIDDLIMRYHGQTNVQIKGKTHKVVQRLHKKSDADGTTEFTITYNLPLSEGLMKGPKKKTFLQAVTWRKTGKVFNSKGGRVSESTMTRIQEIGTARVLSLIHI